MRLKFTFDTLLSRLMRTMQRLLRFTREALVLPALLVVGATTISSVSVHCYADLPTGVIAVDWQATGIEDGSSWEDAYTDLQDALDNIGTNTEIWVATGTYYPSDDTVDPNEDAGSSDSDPSARKKAFTLRANVSMYGGFLGNAPGGDEESISEADPVANPTILSGAIPNQDPAYHVLYFYMPASQTPQPMFSQWFIDGFIIEDALANGTDLNSVGGGALISVPRWEEDERETVPACPRFIRCVFRDNSATTAGAGIASNDAGVFVDRCEFRNNEQTTASPGEVANFFGGGGGVASVGPTVVIKTKFVGNTAAAIAGGAIIETNRTDSPTHLVNCEFFGNAAPTAGGANVMANTSSIVNCLFAGNEATTGTGGGLLGGNVHGCTFADNYAANLGGGCGPDSGHKLDLLAQRRRR